MKSICRSIKPYFLYLILTNRKSVEVGKSRPKSDDWDEVVYLYCSRDMRSFKRIPERDREWMRKYLGKVACSFWCGRIEEFHQFMLEPRNDYEKKCLDSILERSALTYDELIAYTKGREYYQPFYLWHIIGLNRYENPLQLSDFNLKRAPQSWCYVT